MPGRASEPLGQDSGKQKRILVVEDDDSVREYVRMVLEHAGYSVVTAPDGNGGLAEYRNDPDRIDLLLTDVVMPNRTGPELVELIHRERPGLRVLFMSAYTGGTSSSKIAMPTGIPLIEKPFTMDGLLQAVNRVFSGRRG